jgi:hypothetical protein
MSGPRVRPGIGRRAAPQGGATKHIACRTCGNVDRGNREASLFDNDLGADLFLVGTKNRHSRSRFERVIVGPLPANDGWPRNGSAAIVAVHNPRRRRPLPPCRSQSSACRQRRYPRGDLSVSVVLSSPV